VRGELGFDVEHLTSQELRLRSCLKLFAVMSALFGVGYLVMGVVAESEFPFVANSLAKDGFFALLALLAISDIRRFGYAVTLIIVGHLLLWIALALMLAIGNTGAVGATLGEASPEPTLVAWLWLTGAAAVVAVFTTLYESALRARFGLRYLSYAEFSTILALSEVLVPDAGRRITPEETAKNVDDYLASFSARGKWKIKLALTALTVYPLLTLRPVYSVMSPGMRLRFVKQRFLRPVSQRRLPRPLRTLVQAMIRAGQQMVYVGYYGDPRVGEAFGYRPFSRRPGYEDVRNQVARDRPALDCLTPRDVDADTVRADVAIVGSGAGGAVLAYRLAEQGRRVLLIERGRHVDPSEFTENEATQYSDLYADGALTLSRDFRFQVLQGMCVGGSTTVNNGVCFDLPERVLRRWNDPDGLDAGLQGEQLRASFSRLREWLPVHQQGTNGAVLNPGARKFVDGVRALGLDQPPYRFGVVDANIDGCVGCGYCNLGCAYGKKLSMLDNVLPRAQAEFGPDGVRILTECRAERIERGCRRATAVLCRLSDGRRLRVQAASVVVSAGGLASSVLLRRSGIGGRNAGRGVCFNLASPLTVDFDEELHSEQGLQISHYLLPPDDHGFALETWFNPPLTQSLFMPGWFEDHARNMARYSHMTSVGVVVGSARNGKVKPALLDRGDPDLDFEPTASDLDRLLAGLELASEIMLEAGARRVMPATFAYHEFSRVEDLPKLRAAIRDGSDISVNSAHPQGGNAISRDGRKGVVDPTLRVHGFENLYVCDASVFPSPTGVNPQLTVMALADYVSRHFD
jgi:choline dehydrogenase-like flavoprotein